MYEDKFDPNNFGHSKINVRNCEEWFFKKKLEWVFEGERRSIPNMGMERTSQKGLSILGDSYVSNNG